MSLSNRFFQTLTSGLLLLILSYNTLVLSQTTYYVKFSNTTNSAATGTITSPFSSVSQAMTQLKAGTFELLLMDNPVYQNASLTLPTNSNYSIRPYSLAAGQTHFPYYINKTFYISVKTATLTLTQIQLIDLDTARATNNPSFRVWVAAVLTLDRVKFADINYTATTSYNTIMYTDGTGGVAELYMKNCEFRNLTNSRMQITTTKLTIENTIFSQMVQSTTAVMAISTNYGSSYNVTYKNVTVQNSSFQNVPTGYSYGFAYVTKTATGFLYQDFTLRNCNISNKIAFMLLSANSTGQTEIPVVTGRNITIENLLEVATTDGTTSQIGIWNHIQGNYSVDYSDFKITNLQLKNSALFQTFQLVAENPQLVPNFTLNGLVIKNSTNAYFYIKYFDTIRIDNVQLQNTTYGAPNTIVAMIVLGETKTVYATNFQCTNTTGPLLKTSDAFNQYVKNWNMNNVSTSVKWSSRYLVFLTHTKDSLSYVQGIAQGGEGLISMENMYINGYYDINGLTSTGNDLGTYALAIIAEYGKGYLNHSRLYNMKLSSFGGGYTNHILMNNLTVDADPSIPVSSIPQHAIFKWGQIREMAIINSNFLNQKNMIILIIYFLDRSATYETVTHPILYFDNLTVINNTVNTRDLTTAYPSLFNIRTPLYPVTATFTNSYFQGNTIITAAILTDESFKVDVDFINNTFIDNYALLEGGVIAGKSMRGSLSYINMANNFFGNNSCLKNGGVLFFLSTQHQIIATNNTYQNNYAKLAGGVGYFSHGEISFTETNATYLNNSAGSYGGAWYLSLRRNSTKQPQVKFIGTSFEGSSSSRDGGAIYVQTGDVSLEDVTLTGSSAKEAGGDVYLVSLATITMSNVNSSGSYSPQGSFLYAEATTDETLTLQNIQVTDVPRSTVDTSLLVLRAGSMILSDAVFKNIYSPMFQITSSSAQFLRNSFENIQCQTENTAFCILQGSGAKISIDDFKVNDVTSNQNLIVMKAPSGQTIINNTNMANLKKNVVSGEYFALTLEKAKSFFIQNSNFTQLEFSGIKSKSSNIQIANSIFSNDISQRVLEEDSETAEVEVIPELRYIVLDSSNSSIIDTDFIANTPATSSMNGGAIQITGTAGSHSIAGCSFQENNGQNGGAISVEGAINSLNIERSQFIDNTASTNGGSIYLAGQGTSITPVISQATFQGNGAFTGGAIYVSNSPLLVQNSLFTRNTAQNGAGITSLGQSSQIISLFSSTFTENSAEIGGALLAFGGLNFDTRTTTFANNTAVYGDDIAGRPHHIWAKVYEVSEAFLFLSDITTEYIKSHYKTVLIYDSQNISLQDPLLMKPGRVPNYLFEFEVLNELNQNITLKSMGLKLGMYALSSSASSSVSTSTSITDTTSSSILSGTLNYTFNESSGLIFDSFYSTGKFDDSMILSAEVVAYDNFSNQAFTLPVLQIPVTVGYCTVGEYYDSKNLWCTPCGKDSFSVADPFLIETCERCPPAATCLGGSVVYPNPGYWRMYETSDNFMKCANTVACLGGVADEGKNISYTGVCGKGYEGVGCGTCSPGYVKAGLNNECVSCLGAGARLHVKYIFFAFMRVGVMGLAVWLYIRGYNSPKDKEAAVLHMSIIKVAIDFMHVLSPILILHTEWPYQVRDLLDAMSSPTSMNRNNFSMDCIIATIRGTNRDIVFIKSVILLLQPACLVGGLAFLAYCYTKLTKRKIKDLMINLIITAVVIAYICQPDILQYTFQLFRCENYGSKEHEDKFLVEDTSVRCWESKHALWVVGLGIPSVILWLFVPVGVLVRLLMKREELKTQTINRKYDLILEKYQTNMFYWELMILSRKLILIVSSIMSYFPYLQTYLGFIILIIAYLFHKQFMPYSGNSINRAESIGIIAAAGIMYTGLYFIRIVSNDGENFDSYQPFLFAIDITAGVLFFGYCIYAVRTMLKKRVRKLTKKITKGIIAANKFRKNSALFMEKNMIASEASQTQGPPLLEFGKNTPFSNMSFTPNARGDSSPSRFRLFSTSKLVDLQSPHSVQSPLSPDGSGGILKTEPIVTGADDVEKIFSPKSQTLVLDSRNLLSHMSLIHKTRESIGEKHFRLIPSPTQERHISFKSVDALCDEIDEDIHDAEEAIPKLQRTNVYQQEQKENNSSNNSSNDEMPNNPTANKRSQFYARMGKSAVI